jgi:hypothetical protein
MAEEEGEGGGDDDGNGMGGDDQVFVQYCWSAVCVDVKRLMCYPIQ